MLTPFPLVCICFSLVFNTRSSRVGGLDGWVAFLVCLIIIFRSFVLLSFALAVYFSRRFARGLVSRCGAAFVFAGFFLVGMGACLPIH